MITAYSNTLQQNVKINGLCNKGEWIGEYYIIGIGMGFDTSFFLVRAQTDQDAIDAFVDSRYGHLVILSDEEDEEREEGYREYAGNNSVPVNLNDVRLLEKTSEVNWFEKTEEAKEREKAKKQEEAKKQASSLWSVETEDGLFD